MTRHGTLDEQFTDFPDDGLSRRARLTHRVICGYLKAIKTGSKYVYQTVPRVLTLWLDMGEAAQSGDVASTFIMVHDEMVNGAMGISPLKVHLILPGF
jgi:serine/threonine-protein kinase ATR